MWFIGVEVEQETSAPPPKKNPGSAPEFTCLCFKAVIEFFINVYSTFSFFISSVFSAFIVA